MNLKKLTTLACFALVGTTAFAQQPSLPGCSVSVEEDEMIKERMLENRRNISREQIEAFQNSRAITYVPVKFTIVGDANGVGYADIDNVFAMLADMNNDYRSQDVQFYLKDAVNSVRYSNNTNIYNNGSGSTASTFMTSNKVANCINIYTSASITNQVASYYSPFGDYIFVLNQMVNGSSSTGSHETGHFLKLPHTFLGWEGTNFNDGTAPAAVNGSLVEKFARTGSGANCATAGDGFCDTPADYLSYRANCPYSSGGLDPTGAAINPEESLIMSYFADACVDSFSPEQKGAMAADLITRLWNNLPAPTPNAVVTGTSINAITPVSGSVFPLTGDVTLTWDAVPNATGYVLFVERTFLGSSISTITKTIVYGTNTYTVPMSSLAYPREYSWKVKPFNQYYTSGAYSSPFVFLTTAPVSSVQDAFKATAEMRILSNPIGTATADVLINVPNATTASMLLYSMDGRQIFNQNGFELNAGDNLELLDVSTLTNGFYILVLTTAEGSLQQKLVIQR